MYELKLKIIKILSQYKITVQSGDKLQDKLEEFLNRYSRLIPYVQDTYKSNLCKSATLSYKVCDEIIHYITIQKFMDCIQDSEEHKEIQNILSHIDKHNKELLHGIHNNISSWDSIKSLGKQLDNCKKLGVNIDGGIFYCGQNHASLY